MKFKNVAYFRVEAVLEDGRTVIGFEPGEVRDIPDEQADRMHQRYPGMLIEVGTVITETPVVVEEENKNPVEIAIGETVTPDEIPQGSFFCDECGFKAKSEFGLISHKRTHLKE